MECGCEVESYVQSVDDSGNVSKNRQQDVNEEIGTAASLKENTKRWEDDGKNDLADIAGANVS